MMYLMDSKRRWFIIGFVLCALALAVGAILYTGSTGASGEAISQTESVEGTVLLTIEGLYEGKPISVASGETVLRVLQKLHAEDERLMLRTKEYSGLGTLVLGMYGRENGTDGKYWQYEVNGVMPQVGAGAYNLKDGDVVEWYFRPSSF